MHWCLHPKSEALRAMEGEGEETQSTDEHVRKMTPEDELWRSLSYSYVLQTLWRIFLKAWERCSFTEKEAELWLIWLNENSILFVWFLFTEILMWLCDAVIRSDEKWLNVIVSSKGSTAVMRPCGGSQSIFLSLNLHFWWSKATSLWTSPQLRDR